MKGTEMAEFKTFHNQFQKPVIQDHEELPQADARGKYVILPSDEYERLLATITILKEETELFVA